MDNVSRREFLAKAALASGGCAVFVLLGPGQTVQAAHPTAEGGSPLGDYDWEQHRYAYLIDTGKCIGCGMCVKACKAENQVPDDYFRTWIERYEISEDGEAEVDSPNGGLDGFEENVTHVKIAKAFFVPKMCNHCAAAPCVQVCPVGATLPHQGRRGPRRPEALRRLRLLRPGLPLRGRASCTRRPTPAGQVHALLPPHHQGPQAGLRARLPGRRAAARRHEGPVRPGAQAHHHRARAVLQPELLTEPKCYYLGLDKEVR